MKKKTFLLYYDQAQIWEGLSDEEAGKLIKLLHKNSNTTPKIKEPLIKFAYEILKDKIDSDYDRWLDTCKKNKENINKRWEYKNIRPYTTVYDRIRSDTNYTDNDNDNDRRDLSKAGKK